MSLLQSDSANHGLFGASQAGFSVAARRQGLAGCTCANQGGGCALRNSPTAVSSGEPWGFQLSPQPRKLQTRSQSSE